MKINMKLSATLAVAALVLGGGVFSTAYIDPESDLFIASAQAQAPATAPAATPAAPAAGGEGQAGPPETIGDYWRLAGITKWFLLGSAIWVTALIIELVIRGRVRFLCPPATVSQLSSTLAVKDYVKAWQFCVDNPSPLSHAMAPALEKIPQGQEVVSDTAMDYMNFLNNIFKIKCSYLNLNATVNTLLGLFGTISGMISAFNKMAYSGATGDPAKLAGSIGEALICTWTGLGIAIFSLYLFYVFTNMTKAAMTSMQRIVQDLINQIDFASVSPDMEVITAEMKARATTAEKGAGSAPAVAPAVKATSQPAAAAKAAEMVQCPHCQAQVQVGAQKCPGCKTELEWE